MMANAFKDDFDVNIGHDTLLDDAELKDTVLIVDEADATIKKHLALIRQDGTLGGWPIWSKAHKVIMLTGTTTPLLW
jgi:hypothetical protein